MRAQDGQPDFYDTIAEGYDAYHQDPKSLAENRLVRRVLRQCAGPDDVVVDLGCGTGLLLDFLDLKPERYVGVDISEHMLEQARRKHPGHRFLAQDMVQPLPGVADGSADGVVSLFGSPAYCDLQAVWQQVLRLLRPGGWYFLMFCGPRYPGRSTLIDKAAVGLIPRRAEAIEQVCTGGTTWGMSCLADMLPYALPDGIFDAALQWDVAVPGRYFRNACFFLNAQGRKPAQAA